MPMVAIDPLRSQEVAPSMPADRLGPAPWPVPARLVLLTAMLAGSFVLAIRVGAVSMSVHDVVRALMARGDPDTITIVRQLRVPRAIQAALVGAALAVSGATFQALLRNPLAEPYVLGVSSGAALGAVIMVVTGWSIRFLWSLPAAAFVGAVLSMVVVFRIAFGVRRGFDTRVLILAGVVVSAFLVAIIWLILTFATTEAVRSAIFWMMGSQANASWQTVAILVTCLVPSGAILFSLARPLNLLAIGEGTAAYLGTSVERTKLIAFATASLLTAASVSVSGTIGFVGLVVPHAIRLVWGSDNRALLPCAAIAGAAFLVLADVLARSTTSATELPIGIVTALVGVPCFVWLLRRSTTEMMA
jgi:iron complex transport system permease protein